MFDCSYNQMMSFERLHTTNDRATPTQMMEYKHAILLYKLFNGTDMSNDWIDLNVQQTLNVRNHLVNVFDKSKLKVGKISK